MVYSKVSKVKLIDVAERAGVSKSTVSQFLNGRFDYMSKDTKKRVQRAVDDLNYVPNNIARSLKTDTTRTIGVIVRDVTGSDSSRAIRGMDDYCNRRGYNLFIRNTDFDPATEARALKSLSQLRVDGLVIASSGSNEALIREITVQDTPVVQFQLEHDDSDKNIVLSDYRRAAFDATDYLIQLGHRRICFLTQDYKRVKSRLERYQGYADALTRHGIPHDERLIQYWQRGAGFLTSPLGLLQADDAPTAFFTQHLVITTDLLRAMNEANISIPRDVSVLGFDDVPMTEFFRVPLTVVQQQPHEVGTEAARLLIDLIQNPGRETRRIKVPCTLIKRASCRHVTAADRAV